MPLDHWSEDRSSGCWAAAKESGPLAPSDRCTSSGRDASDSDHVTKPGRRLSAPGLCRQESCRFVIFHTQNMNASRRITRDQGPTIRRDGTGDHRAIRGDSSQTSMVLEAP